MNKLYFGDNLDILRQLSDENPKGFIDLIYIDPPFNSKRNYNVLFESVDLTDSTAQKEAFADTWSNISYMDSLNLLSDLNLNLYNFLRNLDNINISKSAVSYLTTMAIRLYYIHRLLKDTGSFYLHCDPTMSHYLKILCDLIFGEKNFRNEIIWNRSTNSGSSKGIAKRFPTDHDVIFLYFKNKDLSFFKPLHKGYSETYIKHYYIYDDHDGKGKYQVQALKTYSKDRLEQLEKDNRIVSGKGKLIRFKDYLADKKGVPQNDIWIDIEPVNPAAKEKLGYPTQKPVALMERIISASSKEGDLVADFFCGCGTTIAAAEKLNRKWLGVDISHLAVRLIANRIGKGLLNKTYEIHGFPRDIDSARELANNVKGGRLEFEEWVVEFLLHGILNEKRNEMGYDGYRTFTINKQKYLVMIEVKSGSASVNQVNHFIKTVDDKKGSIGVFVCFADQVTKNMLIAAKKEGIFEIDTHPYADKIQIITVENLMSGIMPKIPESTQETFKKATKVSTEQDTQAKIGGGFD